MIVGIALALALADPASAPVAAAQPAAQLSLAEAGRAIAAGRLDQAKAMLSEAVAAGVKGDPVDRLLADLALARGENDKAIADFQKTVELSEGDSLSELAQDQITELQG